MDIIQLIGRIPCVKNVLKKMFRAQYETRVKKAAARVKQQYEDFGLEAAMQFHKCMVENGFQYSAAFGTMLGAIREHGFIKHDLDLDFWMWKEYDTPNLVECLKKYGFRLFAQYSIDDGRLGKELTFDYKGCHTDVFFIYPPINKVPYTTLYRLEKRNDKNVRVPIRVELPVSKSVSLVKFENIELYVPDNAEELCVLRYGPNYMTPNPGWDWTKSSDSVVVWEEMISKTKVKH